MTVARKTGASGSPYTFVYRIHSGSAVDHVPLSRHTGGLASSGNGNTYPARHVIFNLSPGPYQNLSGMIRPLGGSPGYSHRALPAITRQKRTVASFNGRDRSTIVQNKQIQKLRRFYKSSREMLQVWEIMVYIL